MNFLSSISNAVISASSQALQSATSQIPGVSGYTLGDKVLEFQGKSIWNLYTGTKRVRNLCLSLSLVGKIVDCLICFPPPTSTHTTHSYSHSLYTG